MDMGRGEERVRFMERVTETDITTCKIHSQWAFAVWLRKQTGALYQPRGVGWGGRWEGGSKGGYMCIPMADSCLGLTENSKIL